MCFEYLVTMVPQHYPKSVSVHYLLHQLPPALDRAVIINKVNEVVHNYWQRHECFKGFTSMPHTIGLGEKCIYNRAMHMHLTTMR